MKRTLFAAVAATLVGAATLAFAADAPKPKGPTTKPSATKAAVDPKPVNKFCAVEGSGHDIDPKVTTVYQGKTIAFCCRDCIDEFNKNPEKYVKGMK
jgi:YHS domain-containing protein